MTWSSKTINGPLNDASKPPTSLRARVRISTDEGPAVLSSLSRILGIHAPGARTPCVSVMGWICLAPSAYQFIAGAATIADFRMRRQDGDLRVQLVREPDVVGVEERDELALGVRDPQVAGRAHAFVDVTLVLQIVNLPGEPLGVRPRDRRAAIRRSIVDEKELPVVESLRQDAVDRVREELVGVQEDDDDGYDWNVGHYGVNRSFGRDDVEG